MQRHLRLAVTPWDDVGFVRAVGAISERVIAEHPDVPPILAADLAQRILREMGYAEVAIRCQRTVDDVRGGRATWVVLRDGDVHAGEAPSATHR